MTKQRFSDEDLMAYGDGGLDAARREAIERAMAEDPALARSVAQFAEVRRRAKESFGALFRPVDPAADPLAARILAATEAAAPPPSEKEARPARSVVAFEPRARPAPRIPARIALPLAASIALAVGAGLGWLAGSADGAGAPAGVLAAFEGAAVAQALATLPSGEARALPEGGRLVAVATFRDGAGALCREATIERAGSSATAVACRAGEGWRVRLVVEGPRADDAFVPASGLEALDAFLAAVEAGEPLAPQEEAAALSAAR